MKNLQIKIRRYDLNSKYAQYQSYNELPVLHNLNDIENIDEIFAIQISGDIYELYNAIPKSYQAFKYPKSLYFGFETFHMNGNTGERNESAEKRRIKVIKKLKELGL